MTAQTAPSSKHPLDREFASVTELLAAASKPVGGCPADNIRLAMEYASNGTHDARWYVPERPGITGNTGAQAFIRAANYPEGAARIAKLAAAIEAPEAVTVRRRPRWEDQGDEVDMQRVWAGDLDHSWRRTRRTSMAGASRIRIAIPISALAHVTSEVMAWRGACGLALLDRLAEAGHNVEIVAIRKGQVQDGLRQTTFQTVVVKDYEAPLDLNGMAAMIGCAALFRGVFLPLTLLQSTLQVSSSISMTLPCFEREVPQGGGADVVFLVPDAVSNRLEALAWLARAVERMNRISRREEDPQQQEAA